MIVPATSWLLAAMGALVTNLINHAGAGVTYHLAKAPMAPSPSSTPASFTEADFTGYAAHTVTAFIGPYQQGLFNAEIYPASVVSFTPTGTAVGNTIYGYWMVDSLGNYIGAEQFATPVTVTGPSTPVLIVPPMQLIPWKTTTVPLT